MNGKPVPETVFTGFRIATMVEPDALLRCEFSDQPFWDGATPAYGMIDNAVIAVRAGRIQWIAKEQHCPDFGANVRQIAGGGKMISPGLIDCHTHLVYGGNRAVEWEMRLNGKSYEAISREGGGILSSVRATRTASEDELLESASERLKCLMAEGVTTVEIKSGYGLDVESELKMLRVARKLASTFPVSVESTLLGAHALPAEYAGRPDEYIRLVCEEMIPAAKELCTSVDVFCESIAFDLAQTQRVFETAIAAGLNIKIHAEQLTHMGGAAMAAEMGAISADHLEFLSPDDCCVLKENGTVATLLPGAFYCLKETQKPPVETLREYRVPIAIATDSNPGSSPVVSILLVANMACNLFGLTPEEAFAAITRNAGKALRLGHEIGTLESGKQADFAIWNCANGAEIFYGLGGSPCFATVRKGAFRAISPMTDGAVRTMR